MSEIVAYNPIRGQLAELRAHNAAVVFDYASPKGNKEARSHIHKLRSTKSAIESVRKAEKQSSLDYGRRVDSEAKSITAEIEAMIEVHERPLLEIEAKEKARIEKHQESLAAMRALFVETNEFVPSKVIADRIADLGSYRLGSHWDEFELEAARVKEEGQDTLKARHEKAVQYEAEQADLKRLREEQQLREQKENEARIAAVAVEKERERAATIREQEIEEAARREAEMRRRVAEAEEKAARAAEAERIKVLNETARLKAEAEAESARRENNKRLVARVQGKAAAALADLVTPDIAKRIIDRIADGGIPNVNINY